MKKSQSIGFNTTNLVVCLIAFLILSTPIYVSSESDRKSFVENLNSAALKVEVKLEFSINPLDDTTLIIYRVSTLRPSELRGGWEFYVLSIGSSAQELREKGFNKVRIYTSKSVDIDDYTLRFL